ncbi:MAG: DUF4093 domain-containing protein [Ruthenibacterium sp.]
MMEKPRIEEVIVVEGKYDAAKLADLVDALIIPTGGFSVFTATETKDLILSLGKKRGILVLTDSDAAGFRIRTYLNQIAQGITVKNAYIPAVPGKESRKPKPSCEGLLGVEGVSGAAILQALRTAGASTQQKKNGRQITYADLYELGLSGTQGSATLRRAWLQALGLPPRLSKKALCEVLNSLYTYEEFLASTPKSSSVP